MIPREKITSNQLQSEPKNQLPVQASGRYRGVISPQLQYTICKAIDRGYK